MSNNEGCAASHEFLKALYNQGFSFRIDRRGGFIQDKDRSIPQNGTGNCHTLSLSLGEECPLRTDNRIVSLWQSQNFLMNPCQLSSAFNLGKRRIRFSVGDILTYSEGED